MSRVLTSRPELEKSSDIVHAIDASNAEICVIDDTTAPLFSITLYQGEVAKPLLLKSATHAVTLFDLIKVFRELGFSVDYHEVR